MKDLFSNEYEVVTAENGLQSLEKFDNSFDLVITDQTMSGLLGVNLLIEIIKIKKDIKTILMTGYNFLITKEQIINLGCKCIPKPFNLIELNEIVKQLIN